MAFEKLYKSRLERMADDELKTLWTERLDAPAPDAREELTAGLLATNASRAAAKSPSESPKVRVIFHNQEGPGGTDDVFVSVNGKAWLVKREHEALLPRPVFEAVENAEQTMFERDGDGAMRERRLKRFAYSLLGEVEGSVA